MVLDWSYVKGKEERKSDTRVKSFKVEGRRVDKKRSNSRTIHELKEKTIKPRDK